MDWADITFWFILNRSFSYSFFPSVIFYLFSLIFLLSLYISLTIPYIFCILIPYSFCSSFCFLSFLLCFPLILHLLYTDFHLSSSSSSTFFFFLCIIPLTLLLSPFVCLLANSSLLYFFIFLLFHFLHTHEAPNVFDLYLASFTPSTFSSLFFFLLVPFSYATFSCFPMSCSVSVAPCVLPGIGCILLILVTHPSLGLKWTSSSKKSDVQE